MIQVNIHEAKTNLSKLLSKTAEGESFIIAKAGKPIAKVVPYEKPKRKSILGCMRGQGTFDPDLDFKAIARDEIMEMFYGEDWNKDEPAP
jgi:prevent-host-death family protein